MRLIRTLIFLSALILVVAACGGDDGGNTGEDTTAPDTSGTDTPMEDSPMPDTIEPPACEGPGIMGQVVQVDGNPIGWAKLFLCGVVNGSETCNPRTADDQGYFSFQNLEAGYTHLEVNATLAGVQMGTLFAGWSLVVDPSGPDCLDMGEIVLQELPEGDDIVTADGGTIQIGPVTLDFPAGCPVFPDYSNQGKVGGILVEPADAYWAPEGAVLALALHPFKAHCDPGVTVRVDAASYEFAAPKLMYNDLIHGGAHDTGAMTYFAEADGDGWVLEAAVPDLTWIWIVE